MITIICDCCKKPIKDDDDLIKVSFDPYNKAWRTKKEYHLHTACAIRANNILGDFFSRQGTEVKEDG